MPVPSTAVRLLTERSTSAQISALVSLLFLLGLLPALAHASAGFVGETRCGSPMCHGAALPADPQDDPSWRPWKSARTQWLNRNIDRHSRAFATLQTAESKRIAGYMGIDATQSDKCLVCHAPGAPLATDSRHRRQGGVSCEHCHGPAEHWLEPHKARDWPQQRAQFAARGFIDLNDFRVRADKCASCHVEIDHEIVAGGHPPLQFEMVAYALVMKHWDDQDEQPEGAFSVDPTLWTAGQLTGLRHAMEMVARRAGDQSYQSLGKFAHFQGRECYQCHHKLVADAVRQAQGHYEMADIAMSAVFPGQRGELQSRWRAVTAAVPSGAAATRQAARSLAEWLAAQERQLATPKVDRAATLEILSDITAAGQQLKGYRRFSTARPERSNVVRIDNIDLPWWYTASGAEQAILAIQALCGPAFGEPPLFHSARCDALLPDLRALVAAADRDRYQPDKFAASLAAVHRKLFR